MLVRANVGYLAEDQTMYGWMRAEEIISFMAPFYPTWDHQLALKYANDFEVPLKTKIKNLSKGQNVRLGLVLALAHRPELVIPGRPGVGARSDYAQTIQPRFDYAFARRRPNGVL